MRCANRASCGSFRLPDTGCELTDYQSFNPSLSYLVRAYWPPLTAAVSWSTLARYLLLQVPSTRRCITWKSADRRAVLEGITAKALSVNQKGTPGVRSQLKLSAAAGPRQLTSTAQVWSFSTSGQPISRWQASSGYINPAGHSATAQSLAISSHPAVPCPCPCSSWQQNPAAASLNRPSSAALGGPAACCAAVNVHLQRTHTCRAQTPSPLPASPARGACCLTRSAWPGLTPRAVQAAMTT